MKYQANQKLFTPAGQPIALSAMEPNATLIKVIEAVCLNANTQVYNTGDKKLQVYRLLQKVANKTHPHLECTAEEVSLIKELAAANLGIAAYGAVHDILENPIPMVTVEAQESTSGE